MRMSWFSCEWMRLPTRLALLLGIGALSAAGARAEAPAPDGNAGPAASTRDMLIRIDGKRVYISEGSGEFQELSLADSAEAEELRQLVGTRGAPAGLRIAPVILAGAGGSGFDWTSAAREKSTTRKPAVASQAKTGLGSAAAPSSDPLRDAKPRRGRDRTRD